MERRRRLTRDRRRGERDGATKTKSETQTRRRAERKRERARMKREKKRFYIKIDLESVVTASLNAGPRFPHVGVIRSAFESHRDLIRSTRLVRSPTDPTIPPRILCPFSPLLVHRDPIPSRWT